MRIHRGLVRSSLALTALSLPAYSAQSDWAGNDGATSLVARRAGIAGLTAPPPAAALTTATKTARLAAAIRRSRD